MKKMTWMQHFAELRRRVLWTVAVFVIGFGVGWAVAPVALTWMTGPLMAVWPDGNLLYTGLTDGLMVRFSLATLIGLLVTAPMALGQLWAFVAPGLHAHERRVVWPILVLSPVLFVMGAAFAFYILFPTVFRFFMELNLDATVPTIVMPVTRDYVSFVIGLLKVFGIAFQLPLLMVLFNRAGILSRGAVVRARRYAIVGIIIVAAILTPPDVVSQLLLALPLWGLFEVGIFFLRD